MKFETLNDAMITPNASAAFGELETTYATTIRTMSGEEWKVDGSDALTQ
jgi:hypothetical protein